MGSLQLLVPVSGTQVLPTMPSFIFVLVLASQAFSLPCPSPDFPCAISAAACASGELANKTICASCQVAGLPYSHIPTLYSGRNVLGRREGPVSGQRKRGELASALV